MSSPPIIVTCTGCDFECSYGVRSITLKCRIGNEITTYEKTTAWCNQCDRIRFVEHLPTLKVLLEYERYLSQLLDTSETHRCSLNRTKELKDKITWRTARTAPPHCLTCGSTDISHVDYEKVDGVSISKIFRHRCGGALVIDPKNAPEMNIRYSDEIIWMDIEGRKREQPLASRKLVSFKRWLQEEKLMHDKH